MTEDHEYGAKAPHRIGRRIAAAVAMLAMGSWVVLAVIPMVVAIMALT